MSELSPTSSDGSATRYSPLAGLCVTLILGNDRHFTLHTMVFDGGDRLNWTIYLLEFDEKGIRGLKAVVEFEGLDSPALTDDQIASLSHAVTSKSIDFVFSEGQGDSIQGLEIVLLNGIRYSIPGFVECPKSELFSEELFNVFMKSFVGSHWSISTPNLPVQMKRKSRSLDEDFTEVEGKMRELHGRVQKKRQRVEQAGCDMQVDSPSVSPT